MWGDLSLAQRRVCNTLIVQLCRGFYDEGLETLRTRTALPPLQKSVLEYIVLRMINPEPGEEIVQEHQNAIGKNKDIIEQLHLHGQDTSISDNVVMNVYKVAMESSFKTFRTHLLETQSVEHSKIHQALILTNSCTNLMLAQQKIDKIGYGVWAGIDEKLFLLCATIFLFSWVFFIHLRH